ncbi:MAG TPA: hydantoinase/oxoprolinase family protein [Sulfolobales archaeon]|nr:hydantoinase/oxoprolinase family protein [Sulfolobales archaeon]
MAIIVQQTDKRYRVGIDIGGAFTDIVVYDEVTGAILYEKVESTPKDFAIGVLEAVEKVKIDLSKAGYIFHGQTIVINTVITRRGVKTGLITTKGFRDVLEIQRANRRDMYNLLYAKPEPLVPRYLRLEVDERVMYNGNVIKKLDTLSLINAIKKLKEHNVESVAITFINSYANPVHEIEAKRILTESSFKYVTASYEITNEWREYERTSTAVINAYAHPIFAKYVERLSDAFSKLGFRGIFYIMLSNGGVAKSDLVRDKPVLTIESGPIAGYIASLNLARIIGRSNVIPLDGGSTTTKGSLIKDLTPKVITDYYIERDRYRPGYPVKVPVIDSMELGLGGTSIAWIDEIGNLNVGPQAVGADPGPICYGKGGDKPTLTDAYVVTGLINDQYFLGGRLRLRKDLAKEGLKKLADHYRISIEEVADAIIRIANSKAAYLLRAISVQRGYDPRDFTLIAYGGSGPMFAPYIAAELKIPEMVVPGIPSGVFTAWGMITMDVRRDLVRTKVIRLDSTEAANKVINIFDEIEGEVVKQLMEEGFSRSSIVILRYADMRYYGQEHTIKVPIPTTSTSPDAFLNTVIARFHEHHEKEYTFRLDSPVEIVNFHVVGLVSLPKPPLRKVRKEERDLSKARKPDREAFIEGHWVKVEVYEKDLLPPEYRIEGPAIIEEPTSTIIVSKDQIAEVDEYGNIIIRWK